MVQGKGFVLRKCKHFPDFQTYQCSVCVSLKELRSNPFPTYYYLRLDLNMINSKKWWLKNEYIFPTFHFTLRI